MPPHIAQLVAGHRDINTTMGYKAVYPEEVINDTAPGGVLDADRAQRVVEDMRSARSETGRFSSRRRHWNSSGRGGL